MYKVVRRKALRPTVTQLEIEAPLVARKAKPGQFIILRVDEEGERINRDRRNKEGVHRRRRRRLRYCDAGGTGVPPYRSRSNEHHRFQK